MKWNVTAKWTPGANTQTVQVDARDPADAMRLGWVALGDAISLKGFTGMTITLAPA